MIRGGWNLEAVGRCHILTPQRVSPTACGDWYRICKHRTCGEPEETDDEDVELSSCNCRVGIELVRSVP